jgi:hypothetical protein
LKLKGAAEWFYIGYPELQMADVMWDKFKESFIGDFETRIQTISILLSYKPLVNAKVIVRESFKDSWRALIRLCA